MINEERPSGCPTRKKFQKSPLSLKNFRQNKENNVTEESLNRRESEVSEIGIDPENKSCLKQYNCVKSEVTTIRKELESNRAILNKLVTTLKKINSEEQEIRSSCKEIGKYDHILENMRQSKEKKEQEFFKLK